MSVSIASPVETVYHGNGGCAGRGRCEARIKAHCHRCGGVFVLCTATRLDIAAILRCDWLDAACRETQP